MKESLRVANQQAHAGDRSHRATAGLAGSGRQLDARTQSAAERGFGRNLGQVRIHADRPEAAEIGTPAYAVGRDIVFDTGEFSTDTMQGRRVLFHELAHVAQQPALPFVPPLEQLRLGRRSDAAEQEAAAASAALAAGRPATVKIQPSPMGSLVLRRYEAGEHAQLGEPGISVMVQGHTISYGEMIAMGDFFSSPEEVQKAPWAVIEELLKLIRRDRDYLLGVPGVKKVEEHEWQKATEKLPKGKRYLDLAAKNEAHFAVENKKIWEKLHRQALRLAQKGNMDDAMAVNAFADHFLTDAFAAGHLIQRAVVTKQAKTRLKRGDPIQFARDVSGTILANSDAYRLLMQYEVRPSVVPLAKWRAMSVDSLADLIDVIRRWQPAYFYSNFAKAVHDQLNEAIRTGHGVQVRNKRGDELGAGKMGRPFWELSGDKTLALSPKTRDVAKRAVAESRQQVSAANGVKKLNYDALAAKVWENVPEPTEYGKKQIESAQSRLTDPDDASAIAAFAQIAIDNRQTLVEELEKRHLIRKLPSASGVVGTPPRGSVTTWAGVWETDKYQANKQGGAEVGVQIDLRFKPGDKVNSTLFGMVQMVTTKRAGQPFAIGGSQTIAARSIPAGQAGEGAHIDQYAANRSPLYAVDATSPQDTLRTPPTDEKTFGHHGWRYRDRAGRLHSRDALLKDRTRLPQHPADSSQIFETTALAVTGAQEGTYYGSVQWGWQSDAHNKFTMLPLSRVSNDVPSGTFATAVGLWNRTPTSGGLAAIPFTAATGAYTRAPNSALVSDPSRPKDITVPKIPKNTRMEVTQTRGPWSKVTLVAGGDIGKVGWIRTNELSNRITP